MLAYLHIGAQKTGSTAIQNFLNKNRAALARQHVLYPGSITDNALIGSALPDYNSHNPLAQLPLPKLLPRLQCELQQAKLPRIIISAESLNEQFTTIQQLTALQDFLSRAGITRVEIVIYLREQGMLYASFSSQRIREGDTTDYERLPPSADPRLAALADYRSALLRWGQVFGADHLRVRLFEPEAFYKGDLIRDFLHTCELDWQEDFVPVPHANESLNLLERELFRALNRLIPGSYWPGNHLKFHLQRFLTPALANLSGHADLKYRPPPDMVRIWNDFYADDNEWVRLRFFPERSSLFTPHPIPTEHSRLDSALSPQLWDAVATAFAAMAQHDTRVSIELQQLRSSLARSPQPAP